MTEPLLKIRGLTKSFSNLQILKGINLDIMPGEIIGVIGSSGSGKTTFLNSLIGFLKPESGTVEFKMPKGLSSDKKNKYQSVYKNQKIIKNFYGFAAQLPSFYEKLTVEENLEYFAEHYNLKKEDIKSNVNTLLKMMNLENSANIVGKNLSGGMERRLDIACSLVHNPKLLILDEPTSDLDPVLRNNIWRLVSEINSKGTTIILSSHHLLELENLCTRIAVIKGGKLIAVGTAEELRKQFNVKEQLIIKAEPGKFLRMSTYFKKYKKEIQKHETKNGELFITCKKPHIILKDLIKTLEKNKEKVIELKLIKPDLDKIFITINS